MKNIIKIFFAIPILLVFGCFCLTGGIVFFIFYFLDIFALGLHRISMQGMLNVQLFFEKIKYKLTIHMISAGEK
jgi:hypothetical protein